jgi:voltage-gated sodium channel
MLCVILLGISNALEGNASNAARTNILTIFITVVFGSECILKILTEGYKPWTYFIHKEYGPYNCFDFTLSVLSIGLLFADSSAGLLAGSIRVIRLVRLITRNLQLYRFVKNVSQLRMIIDGLAAGLKSVVYIVILLALLIYLFAIIGCIIFGLNDPARFGTVGSSMVTLFVISTLSNWSDIAYTQWYGCSVYLASPYNHIDEGPPRPSPRWGNQPLGLYQGFTCTQDASQPASAFIFFTVYIIITSWVVMSLFIGVISMGMLEAFLEHFEIEKKRASHDRNFASLNSTLNGTSIAPPDSENRFKILIDASVNDVVKIKSTSSAVVFFQHVVRSSKTIRDSTTFSFLVSCLILVVVVEIGISQDLSLHCSRQQLQNNIRFTDCTAVLSISVIFNLAQAIFLLEVAIKFISEGRHWWRFFTDKENGHWNAFDFFIVALGLFDSSPSLSIGFPPYVLRLLSLLRLFRLLRLARALPRLRSIVESLISGLTAVGWVLLLILIFNYTAGSICMYIFAANDPFHFGTLSRSMFALLQIETLDNWVTF